MKKIACLFGLLLPLSASACSDSAASKPAATPFDVADPAIGGAMYDKWWKALGLAEPTGDHPLWATRPDTVSNTRTGLDTWRCKECHGWDYKGVNGKYGSGSHKTGFPGVFGTTKTPDAIFALLSTGSHAYTAAGVSDDALWNVTRFIVDYQVDVDDYIDSSGAFVGDAAAGATVYASGVAGELACASCHGDDGLTPPPTAGADYEDFVGFIANDNAVEFLHKLRFGQPATAMPSLFDSATEAEVLNLATFAQTLPQAP